MRFRNLTLATLSILLVHLVTPAQQPVAALDRNDPELRAILSQIESDIEKGRIEKKIAVRTVTFSEFAVSIVNQKLVVTVPEILPGSVVYMKETPLEPFGGNIFHVAGGSFYGNFMTFESNRGGSMVLNWRTTSSSDSLSTYNHFWSCFPSRVKSYPARPLNVQISVLVSPLSAVKCYPCPLSFIELQ